MLSLESPITVLPFIGPKYKKFLEKLEISTLEDLLYHFPFRYDDFSNTKNIKDAKNEEILTVKGELGEVQNIFTKYGKKITKAEAKDSTGKITLIWFNQHYLKKVLEPGKVYNISGKVSLFNGKPCLISPEMEDITKKLLHTGRLVPIYPETAGISSKWLRNRINDVLSGNPEISEFLPDNLMKIKKLLNISNALNCIHFPSSQTQANVARFRFEFEELFLELLNVEKRRKEWEDRGGGIPFEAHKEQIDNFISNLPFQLTESQNKALQEIIGDLQKPLPMNRLLEGDVGTGKTVVAVVASYLANLNGYKTMYLAPTEILANQHYETFHKLLPEPEISLITGSTSKRTDKTRGQILIGTHALLFNDKKYEKVGLIIVDEQHRFGVEQRGKIIEMSKDVGTPHLLTMTATPIPRTLALTIYGDLSLSTLKEHPNTERKITTKVLTENARMKAYEWIKQKNQPTFIVCPLIEPSDSTALENIKAAQEEFSRLKETVFEGVNIGILHGRMKSKEKQEIIEKFRKGKITVLVSTPVIEVGIDIPDATVMVIESSERYGLASLHQLRGRVGRGQKEGFCFLMMTTDSRPAYERLKNLEEVNDGLKLAEIDMKIRGQGDIWGTMQHGMKKFKIADLTNLELLEEAKAEAQKYYPDLDKYPLLLNKLTKKIGKYIPSN